MLICTFFFDLICLLGCFPIWSESAKLFKCNWQRFKEMKEMHGSSSRDDRQKREQQRQEKEMAKFVQTYAIIFPSLVHT